MNPLTYFLAKKTFLEQKKLTIEELLAIEGVEILDTKTLPCRVEKVSSTVFKIILEQGLNRQIRRMCSALGYSVKRLQRIRIMNIHLGKMKVGEWRDLTEKERTELFALLNYKQQ